MTLALAAIALERTEGAPGQDNGEDITLTRVLPGEGPFSLIIGLAGQHIPEAMQTGA
jgi:hypothetical protein